MSNYVIIEKNKDGSCFITCPDYNFVKKLMDDEIDENGDIKKAGLTEIEAVNLIMSKDTNSVDVRVTDVSNLPADDLFRDAWTDDNAGETVDIDMSKAREIQMNTIRNKRQEKFSSIGFSEKPNPEIENLLSPALKKQLKDLRDITTTFDLSKFATPEELKNAYPVEVS